MKGLIEHDATTFCNVQGHFGADVRIVKALVPGPHGWLTAETVSLRPEDHPYTNNSTVPHAT